MNFEVQRFGVESGPKWIREGADGQAWLYIPAGATYTKTVLDAGSAVYSSDGNETIRVTTGVEGIEGETSTAVTATLTEGAAISDVVVTGSGRELLRITIGGVEYGVDSGGKLVDTVSLAIERVVNSLAGSFLGISDTAVRAAAADRFTTGRELSTSDNAGANTGAGVSFDGSADATLKMPAAAEFERVTAGTLVLGSTPSTVEGAMWVEWS